MKVRWKDESDRDWLEALLRDEWGGASLIVRGMEKPLPDKPTLIAGEREGVAIFERGEPAELLLLHALRQLAGIGSALLDAVIAEVRSAGSCNLLVATTNDNLPALRFYQKRGFVIHAVRINGVAVARRMKPAIPLLGFDGIPIRDEIDLMLPL